MSFDLLFWTFHKLDETDNIGIKGFTNWKQKKSSNKMLPTVRTEPGTSDSMSEHSLSELTWHVLLREF